MQMRQPTATETILEPGTILSKVQIIPKCNLLLIYDFMTQLQNSILGFLLVRTTYFQSNSSRNYLFVATIQICNELVFFFYVGVFQPFVKQLPKFNIKQEGSMVLGRSPDMTIHKVSGRHNHSQHYSCQFLIDLQFY